jgi:hypothetical protein
VLIRRIAQGANAGPVDIPHPIRTPRSKLVKPGELERAVDLAARKAGSRGALLVLLDSDDACPAHLGPQLLERARAARSDVPISVVLAKREFESWFLAAADSLRDVLLPSFTVPADPEAIRGAKEWLDRHAQQGTYRETLHQPAWTQRFDLTQARRAPSFARCCREIERLLVSAPQARRG